ncbi:unnamed protein product [Ixodes pacificus]
MQVNLPKLEFHNKKTKNTLIGKYGISQYLCNPML